MKLKGQYMRIPPLALLVICAAISAASAKFIPILGFDAPSWLELGVLMFGISFLLPAIVAFAKSKTTANPISPSAATTLVTSGVYTITRDPMYVGMLLILLAIAVQLGSIGGLFSIPLFFVWINRFQIGTEEKQLLAKFGQKYLEYTKRVPRWLIIREGTR